MDGILIVDKPQGWTSHDVVDFIRKRFRVKKAGHTGTLDPMATGVLVVLLGRSTKLCGELMAADKEYEAVLTLGKCTDTQDETGRVVKESPLPRLDKSAIEGVLRKFTGRIMQVPPMFSAVKLGGRPLYKLARRGITIERRPRETVIEKLELVSFEPGRIRLRVVCSKGTYIRTLCEDIAAGLGSAGCMSYLRRARCGSFTIGQAVTVEKLKEISCEDLKSFICVENRS